MLLPYDRIEKGELIKASLSSPKCTLRLFETSKGLRYQLTETKGTQSFHKTLTFEEARLFVETGLKDTFTQALLKFKEADFQVLRKNEKLTVLKKPSSLKTVETSHNRVKQHILQEGIPNPYLMALGVMNKQGQVYPKMQDKFRQINRFLEIVEESVAVLPKDQEITVVDFGCGKAYLTFSLHALLTSLGFKFVMVGLDLKKDVIEFCKDLSQELKLENLHFRCEDISDFDVKRVDMMVALHACNTATDLAIAQAVKWKAKLILAAPCCQHELYSQIKCAELEPLLKHGILKERFAALVTDAARAELLSMVGYQTQVLEFIDAEHTPKNLLIRAQLVKGSKSDKSFKEFKSLLHIFPTLEKLINGFLTAS